ncbi:MAG: HAMP domain-containing histidine kinase [Thermoplasmata archaeon]|nr:MAG: HAMP domain-containing histidine kinase [Thermoplasmata archaeon]
MKESSRNPGREDIRRQTQNSNRGIVSESLKNGALDLNERIKALEKEIEDLQVEISERKKSEKRIMEERNRTRLYLDILTHDIGNMNQAILMSNEYLLLKADIQDEYKELIQSNFNHANATSDLILNIKKFSNPQQNEFLLERTDISGILKNAIERVYQTFPKHDIEINFSMPRDNVFVRGNELLYDVIVNILCNAVKYNDKSINEMEINLTEDEQGEYWKLEFKDNGPGIPDEIKDRIFKRTDRCDKWDYGSGLGLTIAYEIINRCGGKIWIEDRIKGDISKGCNFIVILPKL